ncbi:bifunctional adenosylcobinamide kinase/adenosylcobinamide-phosphate guanylyltransferase [Ruminococcus sp.]|uniref:bifunctional adenosylcobinamide kinase/adenosylcobinamide-phosphate guanylyltransferase n=1 Tax=Ruminococcus sp. TaxID=41978 RepID=UPI0025F3F6E9|nr:bifunctional adenosylcobinamide kinase/adenosylcobinamide-phosphate guanylyltransferase [Ruminococcus sp.]MCR4638115.1 bifunctional adenosylcobinamide kinase/adenosylcobinamide-phosphate guanylyltransferase [Ruminococcus sp.]
MTTLVTGGSKCGKSSLAEHILEGFCGRKVYIATMQPFGEEALEAIERHKKMRCGNGFETVEKYSDIHEIPLFGECGVLLECVGNLCANEMFSESDICYPADKIVSGIKRLSDTAAELVIVTNQVGSDGIVYAEGTAEYIRLLGEVNRRIAELADNVIECVYGVPIVLKGEIPC